MINPDQDVIARFQCDHPEEAEALFQEGVQCERERITALLKLAHPATSAIINAAISDGREPAEIFNQCFRARERAVEPNDRHGESSAQMPNSAGQKTRLPPQPTRADGGNVRQHQRSAETFGQTLKENWRVRAPTGYAADASDPRRLRPR